MRSRALEGRLKVLFIAPEQLANLDTLEFIEKLEIGLLVVDEAHCISTWGHDFRPAYRQIVHTIRTLGRRNPNLLVLGLTATASDRTETDIAAQIGDGHDIAVHRHSMDRPNLALSVIAVNGVQDKLANLLAFVKATDGTGILYCATREQSETVASFLQDQGLNVKAYHAGFEPEEKRALQHAFIRGDYKAIAATNALGMGIDKPDVRFIVHVDVPGSITAYYQEVGRAGRDGLPARGLLLFDPADRKIQEHFIYSAEPTPDDFKSLRAAIKTDDGGQWPNLAQLKIRTGLHPTRVTVITAELLEQGFVEKVKITGRQVYRRLAREGAPTLDRYINQRRVKQNELKKMFAYARGEVDCLMKALRHALGDQDAAACGHCHLCDPRQPMPAVDPQPAAEWLDSRCLKLPPSKVPVYAEGITLLKGEDRSPLFVSFMRRRANPNAREIDPELMDKLQKSLRHLPLGLMPVVVPLPSGTWSQRLQVSGLIAEHMKAEVRDVLTWSAIPARRQGQLLNNDQRRENVRGKMRVNANMSLGKSIVLVDDYCGSMATIKEAVRALRKQARFKGTIIPLTIARIKWRLGRPGMI